MKGTLWVLWVHDHNCLLCDRGTVSPTMSKGITLKIFEFRKGMKH